MIDPVVFKYPVPDQRGEFTVYMRKGSKFLHLDDRQGSFPKLWVLSDRDQPLVGVDFIALPTGEERRFLEDGDEVIMRGFCEREGLPRIGFGECRGIVTPARSE